MSALPGCFEVYAHTTLAMVPEMVLLQLQPYVCVPCRYSHPLPLLQLLPYLHSKDTQH